jgi:hypothetical protein
MADIARELKLEEELGKKKQALPVEARGDVFDRLGNDGMKEQVETAKTEIVEPEKAPMEGALDKAMAEEKTPEVEKKEDELVELKAEEAPVEELVPTSHKRALSNGVTALESITSDTEKLKKLVRPDLSEAENASRILAELNFRLAPADRIALKGADHSDLTSAMVIGTISIREGLAVAPELGTFAPIAWQMLEESLHNVGPLHTLKDEEELDLNKARRALRPISSEWRLSLSGLGNE